MNTNRTYLAVTPKRPVQLFNNGEFYNEWTFSYLKPVPLQNIGSGTKLQV